MRYLLKIFWPADLAIIYPLPEKISALTVAAAAAVLIFISAAVWLARKRGPYLLIGWLWFLGTLVPVIGLVQVGGAALADRYTYLPAIGIFIAVVFGLGDLRERFQIPKPAVAATAILILAGCIFAAGKSTAFLARQRNAFPPCARRHAGQRHRAR